MEIIVGKTSGFCAGVAKAVNETLDEANKNESKLYCLGELVHNNDVIKELEQKGVTFIENIEDADGKTIIRAHGVPKEIYEKANKLGIEIIDLTCPNVLKIHNIAEKYANDGYYIFLVGGKKHPETIGSYSFCGENSSIIESLDDIENAITNLKISNLKKVLVIVQTTYSIKGFEEICIDIKNKISEEIEIEIKNTICMATELRQRETEELSKNVDAMLIIGGKNSSNTKKLYEVSIKNCKNVYLVENKSEIELSKLKDFNKIGIMAGASTPKNVIEEACEYLKEEVLQTV